jgi:ribonuclease HI
MWPSNQVGEVLAIKEAVETAPLNVPLRIYSDSKYAIDGFTKNLQKWQDEGFYTVANETLFELTVAKIRERTAPTEFVWVKGHSGVARNEAADTLAGEGILKPDEDMINVSAQMAQILPGAKLKAITQSKAYQIIRKLKMEKPATQDLLRRPPTKANMAMPTL